MKKKINFYLQCLHRFWSYLRNLNFWFVMCHLATLMWVLRFFYSVYLQNLYNEQNQILKDYISLSENQLFYLTRNLKFQKMIAANKIKFVIIKCTVLYVLFGSFFKVKIFPSSLINLS